MRLTFLHGKQPAQILMLHGLLLPGILLSNSRRVRRRGLPTPPRSAETTAEVQGPRGGIDLSLVVEDVAVEAAGLVGGMIEGGGCRFNSAVGI